MYQALEHFGLGRYGDPLDVNGHEVGFRNMANLLENDGTFYLSTPIGRERVEFNANRVFNPNYLLELARSLRLDLREMILIRKTHTTSLGKPNIRDLERLGQESYTLALFIFKKKRLW